MEREELEELVNYCTKHDCFKCLLCEECDEIDNKIGITLASSIGIVPSRWSDEDIDYILDEINKKNEDTSK